MAGVPRSYKKNIAEGKGFLFFSILFSVFLRIIYFINSETTDFQHDNGYFLWNYISHFFENPYISIAASSVCLVGMTIIIAYINTKYLLIRRRTFLPSAILILLFSCHPAFIFMSAEYVAALLFLYILAILFASYNSEPKQAAAFKITFFLALSGLFTPWALLFLPVLWLSLAMVRCFNAKSILASLFSIIAVYFPVFSYYLYNKDLNGFLAPYIISWKSIINPVFLEFSIIQWIALFFFIILLAIIITDNYINRHKDKIRIRAYLNMLNFITCIAFLLFIFVDIDKYASLYVGLITISVLLSHLFSLAEQKVTVVLFYIFMLFYFLICLLPILPF